MNLLKNNKKAAMFGLDARIALAIFGALSVISGAALYSAIRTSKATAFLYDLNELSKAYEMFLLDTGTHLRTKNTFSLITSALYENTTYPLEGWKGPYMGYQLNSAKDRVLASYKLDFLRIEDGKTWGGSTNPSSGGATCGSGERCSAWIQVLEVEEDIYEKLDLMVDGEVSKTTGKVRYTDSVNTVYYKSVIGFQ